MRRELVILLVLFSVFLAIGCAEDDTEEPVEEVTPVEAVTPVEEITPEPVVTPVREEAAPEETPIGPFPRLPDDETDVVNVSIVNRSFNPETVTVSTGETVRWTNLDQEPHTVAGTGTGFGSPALAHGASYDFLFTDPGTYEYYCSIHPEMRGFVVVTEGNEED